MVESRGRDSKITVWFQVPVMGVDPATGENYVSSRHFVIASQVVQDSDLTLFNDRYGAVVASWSTRDIEKWAWFINLEDATLPKQAAAAENPVGIGSKEWLFKIRQKYPRAYEPWDSSEENQLRSEISKNMKISEIAVTHQRGHGAISRRLKKLGLVE